MILTIQIIGLIASAVACGVAACTASGSTRRERTARRALDHAWSRQVAAEQQSKTLRDRVELLDKRVATLGAQLDGAIACGREDRDALSALRSRYRSLQKDHDARGDWIRRTIAAAEAPVAPPVAKPVAASRCDIKPGPIICDALGDAALVFSDRHEGQTQP